MNRHIVLLSWLIMASDTLASELVVTVVDRQGQPFEGAVIYVSPETPVKAEPVSVEISQQDLRFTPLITVIPTHSQVTFSNKDAFTHNVYSFAKNFRDKFNLRSDGMIKRTIEKAGEIVMGCNVHDWMISYIYVVDTPYYGQSSESGKITFDIPTGSATLHVRHPRIRDKKSIINRNIKVSSGQKNEVTIKLKKKLLPMKAQIPDDKLYLY